MDPTRRNPWTDMFMGNAANTGTTRPAGFTSPRSSGITIPNITGLTSGIDPVIQALIARFPDIFNSIMDTSDADTGTDTSATVGDDGSRATSGNRTARVPRAGVAPDAARGGGGMNGYPNMRRDPGGAMDAVMNTAPRGGGFVGMVDRLRQAERMAARTAKRADRGDRGGNATSNANGGTVRMGDVNDPNAHIDIDVSGGREVERAQRARRTRGY